MEEYAFELELNGIFADGMQGSDLRVMAIRAPSMNTANCPPLSSRRAGTTLTCRIDVLCV